MKRRRRRLAIGLLLLALYVGVYGVLSRRHETKIPERYHPGGYTAWWFFAPVEDADGISARNRWEQPLYYGYWPLIRADARWLRHPHESDIVYVTAHDQHGACTGDLERILIRGVDD